MTSRPDVSVSPTRAKIEHASHPALQRVSRLPLGVSVGILLGLVILGGALGGLIGALLVLSAAGTVTWLAYLTWPHLSSPERMMRAAVILLLLAIALVAGISHAILI